QTGDLEVRHRAESLAAHLQKRVETARLLEPWRGRVVFLDTPLSEAVTKFANQTKFPIQLAPRHNRENEAKISYDSGETNFWPAFDQFCQRAGLVENPTPAPVTEQTLRVSNGNVQLQAGVVISGTHTAPQSPFNGRLLLVEGKPTVVPTCYAGAVRMRALPQPATSSTWGPARGEGLFMLEVTPQPKMAWLGVVDVHIDKAVDEQEQDLQPILPGDLSYIAALGGNNVMIWEPNGSGALLDARQVPVRLRAGEKPSKTLVEVRGRVAAQVQTPQKPIIIVEDVFKAADRH